MAEKKQPAKTTQTFYIGTGRRKTSVARVRITEGKGNVVINDRPVEQYFAEDKDRAAVLGPLKITEQLNRLDVFVKATGGGVTGQAGAVSQGIARALKTMFSPESEHKRHTFNNIHHHRRIGTSGERERAISVKPLPPTAAPKLGATPLIPGAFHRAADRPGGNRHRHDQEAPRLRLSHARRPHEGTEEVRPSRRTTRHAVLQAITASKWNVREEG